MYYGKTFYIYLNLCSRAFVVYVLYVALKTDKYFMKTKHFLCTFNIWYIYIW